MNPVARNKSTLRRLPKAVRSAVAAYYHNRDTQKPWDKSADIAAIEVASTACGVSFSACAGTFWFKRKHVCIEVNNLDELKRGGKRSIERAKLGPLDRVLLVLSGQSASPAPAVGGAR